MEKAGAKELSTEQRAFHGQLGHAVNLINQADDLLERNEASNPAANARATALFLSAIARVIVLETAERYGMENRLPTFSKTWR